MAIQIETPSIQMLRDRLMETGGAPSIAASADDVPPLGGDASALALLDATIEAMTIMLAADGEMSVEEKELLKGAVRELTANGVRSAEIDRRFEGALDRIRDAGAKPRLIAVAAVLKGETVAAEAAFVLSAAMAFADNEIADEENETLNAFAELLGIDEDRANVLLDELET